MALPWVLCGVLALIIIVLFVKIYLLKKSMDEICAELTEHPFNETNTLISVSSGDRQVRRFADELNKQLRILRKQRQQYISGDRELKEAVTNISHDLRTPLTAIYSYLDLLEQEEKSQTVTRYLAIIADRTALLKQLTEELFKYSVITVPQNSISKETLVLNEVLEESIAQFYSAFKENGIVPQIELPPEKVLRILDRSILSRIFSNLLQNTVKYSDGDLAITLTPKGEITFTNTASKLDQVKVGKLFDRFYTVEDARKSTGLGLAITKNLVEQMGGSISARYKNNQLSVCVLFPDTNVS